MYVFRFSIQEPITVGADGYEDELLRRLNLLQENIGTVDVFPTDAAVDDYLKTIYVQSKSGVSVDCHLTSHHSSGLPHKKSS